MSYEFTKRRVRIQCPSETPYGFAASIVDVETGDEIPNVFRAIITVDAEDANKAEITYYATDEQGKIIVKDGAPVVQAATTNNFETDITAFEVKLKHDGSLDNHYTSVLHATATLSQEAFTDSVVQIGGGYGDPDSRTVHLDPEQSLSLLSWLQQEKPTLERLIQEVPRERE